MKLVFLGVGEAFDENYPNNSNIVLSDTKLLLDCGYSIPAQLWKYNPDKDFLDAIYISHYHADHYFGLPAVFLRMWEEGRKKPLTIICQEGYRKRIEDMVEIAYPDFSKRFEYKIDFSEVTPKQALKLNELTLSFAPTTHSFPNLAIKVSDGQHSFCYSGDGMFNQETEKLYQGSDLVIQETYKLDETILGHANAMQLIEMAKRRNVKAVALTHLNRYLRRDDVNKIRALISREETQGNLKVLLPNPLDEYEFG